MHDQPANIDARYRLIGTRHDGSPATVLGSMTLAEAQRAREAIEKAEIFAAVEVAVDSGDDIPANG